MDKRAIAAMTALCAAGGAMASSGEGVDTVIADAANPTAQSPFRAPDPRGLGTFRLPVSHTPTGQLYDLPWIAEEPTMRVGRWTCEASLVPEVLLGNAGNRNSLYRQYRDPKSGLGLAYLSLFAIDEADAKYIEAYGGDVGRKDQYYGVLFGRYNDYKVRLSYDETPHFFSNANSYWQGLGSNNLTLPPSLTPGLSTPQQVQAAVANGSGSSIELIRKKFAGRLDYTLTDTLKAYASYTYEKRSGDRPFTAGMFFPIQIGPFNIGGINEMAEPIDYQTHDVAIGIQHAGVLTQWNIMATGSLFRNSNPALTWQNPFDVGSVIPGVDNSANLKYGQMALAPDNSAFNFRGELARRFPDFYNARFNATLSSGRMMQNDTLLPPTINSGVAGTIPPFIYNNDNWNSTDALSRKKSAATIDTQLADLKFQLSPTRESTLRAKVRYYETDNHTSYTAYNPITGQYGYLAMGGGQGNAVPGESGIYTGVENVQYRSIPFDGSKTHYGLDGDYRLGLRTVLTGEYQREEQKIHYRERDETWEDRIKLGLSDRHFDDATLRLSFEHAMKRGSAYNYDPYVQFYTQSLPGFGGQAGVMPFTLAQMRKFDIADRDQQTLNARLNYMITPTLDGGVTLQYKSNRYPADYGRTGRQNQGTANLDLSYTPDPSVTAYAYYGYEQGRMRQRTINDDPNHLAGGSAEAGGVTYPFSNEWSVTTKDRTHSVGMGLKKTFSRGWVLDVNATYSLSTTGIDYSYATPGGATIGDPSAPVPPLGNSYPDERFSQATLSASLLVPVNRNLSTRYFVQYERISISDWHYSGLDSLVLNANGSGAPLNASFIDRGPSSYRVAFFGVQFGLKF
jgi:MtrB/PioB family decaheme-associated outer membrane protein